MSCFLLAPSSLNFLRTGHRYRSNSDINGRLIGGYWWGSTSGSATWGHYFGTEPTIIIPQAYDARGYGFAIRCVVREENKTDGSYEKNRYCCKKYNMTTKCNFWLVLLRQSA